MARSKGSPAPSGGPPQGWYPPEHDLQARGAGQQVQPQYPQPGQPPYQGQPYPPQPTADPFTQPPRGFEAAAQPPLHQAQASARPQWVPAFERYTPPSHPQQALPPAAEGYEPYPAQREPMPQDAWRGQEPPRTAPPAGYPPQVAQGYPHAQPGGYLPEPSFGAQGAPQSGYPHAQPAGLSSYVPPGQQGYAPPHNQYAAPQGLANGYAPQPGYGAAPGHPDAHPGNSWQTAEQQNWDLAHYQPGQMPQDPGAGQYPGPELTHDVRYAPQGHAPAQQWGDPLAGHDSHIGHGAEPHFDQMRGGHHDEFGAQLASVAGERQDSYAYDEPVEEAEEEEPKRGPRTMVIVSALLGAIVLGGGLAYTYKMFSDGKGSTSTPVVRADKSPAKMKPTDPGGKDVANIDKKFLNKLGEEKAAAAAASSGADADGGSRKVTTLIVNRDGSLTPQGGSTSAAPSPPPVTAPAAAPSSGVPGLFVEGLSPAPAPSPVRPQLRSAAPTETPPAAVVPAAPAPAPRVADLPLPKVKAEPPAARKKPAVRDDALAPAAGAGVGFATTTTTATASTGSATTSGGNGYVAVVSSKKTREEALKSFADLTQKYPDAVSGMTPDVKEVDLGAKGVWYRLVLGPPGSREAAKDVCTKLEASGFKGCWSSAY